MNAVASVQRPDSVPQFVAAPNPTPTDPPLDDAADPRDTIATMAQELSHRAAVIMLAQQTEQQVLQAKLDRMKADFNATQEEHTERLREMNALRDMALEQAKKDDEVLKKYIAMI